MLNIPQEINKIIKTLEKNGFKAYIVGGCVRDLLSGLTPNDYDVTTNALPEDIKSIFTKTADTGIKHGTVTVITENGSPVEVTTFRTESGYGDMRRPEKVAFVSDIKDDLSRRDFTVNAMAYNENDGIIDLFGGKKDLENKILRAVGEPEKRFFEDALRIMRFVRFSSALCFKGDRKTKKYAFKLCKNLQYISAERVRTELFKTLSGNRLSLLNTLIKKHGLESFGIKYRKNIKKIAFLNPNPNLRFFALLKLCGADTAKTVKSLKLSNEVKNYLFSMENAGFLNIKSSDRDIKYALSLFSPQIIFDLCDYKTKIENIDFSPIKQKTERIIKSAEPYKISHLAVKGKDLLKIGLKDKEVGETLRYLCDRVWVNPEENRKDILLGIAKNKK